MKKKFTLNFAGATAILVLCVLLILVACRKQQYATTTTTDVNITGYLEQLPDQFSLMTQMINKADASGFLGAYGNYTLFTPTNDAITEWLKTTAKADIAALSKEEARNFVNYHLILDTLNTKNFTDGKLQSLTQFGQYITTGVVTSNGVATYVLNKNAKIIKANIRVGNGVLQVIDHALQPKTKTLAQMISENPRYSFFKQALEETGFYDSLNVDPATATNALRRFQTVITESDSSLKAAGFSSYEALKAKLSTRRDPKNHADSLWLYVAYHISVSANYLADVVSTSALTTLAPSEVVTTKFAGQKVLINEVEFNGATEPGVELNRTFSDQSASNGVIHDARAFYKIKIRLPTALYWDMELDGISQNPRNPLYQVGAIDLYKNGASFNPLSYANNDYTKIGSAYNIGATGSSYYNKSDFLNLSISGPTSNKARPLYHDFRTPLLVKGLYKVWVCYRRNVNGNIQWTMNPGTANEQILPNTLALQNYLTASGVNLSAVNSDALLESTGYKRYMALNTERAINAKGEMITGDVLPTEITAVARLVGIANIRTTDRQWIRVSGVAGISVSNAVWIDMIHFIPVEQDQLYPRFSRSGTVFKRP